MRFDVQAYRDRITTESVGANIVVRDVTSSTMDDARAGSAAGGVSGTAYVADQQTAGRGRFGRPWASSCDGLYVTYHLRVPESPAVPLYGVAAALAVSDAIREVARLTTDLKWPNDVLAQGRKIAGILAEAVHRGEVDIFIGIGVNVGVGAVPTELSAIATSIEGEVPAATPSREDLLVALSAALERHSGQLVRSPAILVEEWRQRLVTLRHRVRLTSTSAQAGDVHEGEAVDVSPRGELVVRLDSGVLASFAAGDVTMA